MNGYHVTDSLGVTANVLRGIKGESPSSNQFFPVTTLDVIDVTDRQITDSDHNHFGPFLQLTFHSSFTSLLQQFYSIIQFADDTFEAGGIALQPGFSEDSKAQKKIADVLGIKPEHTIDAGKSFVLARYWKTVHTHTATMSISKEYVSQFKNINRSQPDDIISIFSKYGTHFVSEYDEGDFIYQVFVYQRDIFEKIEHAFPDEPMYRFGWRGVYFRAFTEQRLSYPNNTIYGYSSYTGKILAASSDPAFKDIAPLLYDDVYGIDSIFMFLSHLTIYLKTNSMKSLIASRSVLKSISNVVYSNKEEKLQKDWEEVLRGTLFQKFGSGSFPGFPQISYGTPLSFYRYFNPDLVTRTATSFASIIQAKFDLTDLKILNPAFVTDLFIFADVLEIPYNARIHLPGSDHIYLICRQFISHSHESIVPEIIVGNVHSEPNITIIASSFNGVMKLSSAKHAGSRHVTYVGGSVFENKLRDSVYTVISDTSKELQYPLPSIVPELYCDSNSKDCGSQRVGSSFLNGMELLIMTIETVYSLQVSDSTETAEKSLKWLIHTLGTARNETETSGELEVVLSRALLIEKMNPRLKGSFLLVPKLTFAEYQQEYNSLLASVKLYEDKLYTISREISSQLKTETLINSQKELNENILKIGKFLVGQVESDSQYFSDVNNMFKKIANRKRSELADEESRSIELSKEVLQYSDNVKSAGEKLSAEVKQEAILSIVELVTDMVQAVGKMFVEGVGIANIKKNIEGIARVAKKISYVATISKQIETLFKSIQPLTDNSRKVNGNLINLPNLSQYTEYFPTGLDWEDFDAEIAEYTTPGYLGCCGHTAAVFKNIASKLSSRGRAYLESQKTITSLQYDIVVNRMHSEVANKQSNRLIQLKLTLQQNSLTDYQANTTDLYEIGNILQSEANRVRMQLAHAYLTMDAALQYDTLQSPTPLSGYNTLSIQSAASEEISKSIEALESFPSQPIDLNKPVIFEIPHVRISDLTSENGYSYTMPLSATPFQDFVRVRIKAIRVTIDSIESADTDEIYMQCNFTGANFRDRGLHREQKTFSTFGKQYPYVYNYKTGETVIGNRVKSDKYTMMTPFGEWIFSIPHVKSDSVNVNIKYSKPTTTLRIEFYLNVIFQPATAASYVEARNSFDPCFVSDQSEACLLSKAHEHTIAGKWDAIMVMNAARTNSLWKQKYDYDQDHGGFAYHLDTNWVYVVDQPNVKVREKITGILGPPEISFILNNPGNLEMIMMLKDVVHFTSSEIKGGKPQISNTKIKDPIKIVSYNSIVKIHGIINPSENKIMVDLTGSLINNVQLPSLTEKEASLLSSAIQKYFRQLESTSYELGKVEFDSNLTPLALQPRQFSFTTGGNNLNSRLYICILTHAKRTDRKTEPTTCEVTGLSKDTEPLIPKGYTAALYISSELMFEDIIQPDFKTKFGDGTSASALPNVHPHPAYQLIAPSSSKVIFKLYYTIAPTCQGAQYVNSDIYLPGPFTLRGTKTGSLQVSVSSTWTNSIKYEHDKGGQIRCSAGIYTRDTKFTLTSDGINIPTVDSDGIITFPSFSFGSTTVSYDPASWWSPNSEDKNKANGIVANGLKRRITGLNFNIKSVSVFVLTNLIFPNAKVMNTMKVLIPGDLIVLGDIVKDYNPNPSN